MTKPRKMGERRGWAWTLAIAIVKPLLLAFTRPSWTDGEKIPVQGGVVVAANHVSHLDPLTYAYLLHDHGRLPRYLAKAALFNVFFVGTILRATGQIPVYRESADASRALSAAVDSVEKGRLVFVYPEGTLTRQPELWPMTGKTGAAHIALLTGAPLVPIAQWGAQDILYPYASRPKLLPPKKIYAKVGDPVDLDDLRGKEITPQLLVEASDRVMDAVTALLEDIRGESAPAVRFDPRKAGVRRTGNPNAHESRHQPRRNQP